MIHWLTRQGAPRWRLLLPLAVVTALIVAACGDVRPAVSEPSTNIPGDPIVLASVRVDHLLADPDAQGIAQDVIAIFGRLGSSDEPLDLPSRFSEITGIDAGKIEELTFFITNTGGAIALDDLEDAGVALFIKGEFDLIRVLAALEQSNDESFVTEGYKGQTLHVSGNGEFTIAFLEKDLLVVGRASTVRSIVDVRVGDSPGASGPVVESFQRMDPAFIKAVVAIPPAVQSEALADVLGSELFGGLRLFVDLSVLTELETITLSLGKQVTRFEAGATFGYAGEATASRSRDIVEGLLQLAKGLAASEEIASSLDDVTVTVDGNELSILAKVHPRDVATLIDQLEALFAISRAATIFGSAEEPPEVRPQRTRRFDSDEATPEPQPVLLPRLGSGEAPPTHTPARVREQREAR